MKQSIKLFVIASILLNLLMMGILVGEVTKHLLGRPHHLSAKELSGILPEDKVALFEQVIEQTRKDNAPVREQLKQARDRGTDLLKTEPFNKKAYLAEIKNVRELRIVMMQHMAEAIAGYAEKLTPSERAAFAEVVRKSRPSFMKADKFEEEKTAEDKGQRNDKKE